ncbi:unnamed protein product, partial [Urochloa humidicola]
PVESLPSPIEQPPPRPPAAAPRLLESRHRLPAATAGAGGQQANSMSSMLSRIAKDPAPAEGAASAGLPLDLGEQQPSRIGGGGPRASAIAVGAKRNRLQDTCSRGVLSRFQDAKIASIVGDLEVLETMLKNMALQEEQVEASNARGLDSELSGVERMHCG